MLYLFGACFLVGVLGVAFFPGPHDTLPAHFDDHVVEEPEYQCQDECCRLEAL